MAYFRGINRLTKEIMKEIPFENMEMVNSKINKSWSDYKLMKELDSDYKIENLLKIQKVLQNNKSELANLIHQEMGKSYMEGLGEMDRAISHAKFFADMVPKWDKEKRINNLITQEKMSVGLTASGPIYKICAFNFPIWLGIKFAMPQLAMGNPVLIRPPQIVPSPSELFSEMLRQEGVVGLDYTFSSDKDTELIISNPLIKGIFIYLLKI